MLVSLNCILFKMNAEKYKVKEFEGKEKSTTRKKTNKKKTESIEERDKVLIKLNNRQNAKTFTLQDFKSLADWDDCKSFNENGYYYYLSNGRKLECDSKSEIKMLEYLEQNDLTLEIGAQELVIKYDTEFRSNQLYFPDIVILTKDKHIAIIEIKPLTAMSNHTNLEKYRALQAYCKNNGYEYVMIDPDNGYKTFDDLERMEIPQEIINRVDRYLKNLYGVEGECLLEKDDIPKLYNDFSDKYTKGVFKLYLHALVIQRGWFNRYKNGFMVYEEPCFYDE